MVTVAVTHDPAPRPGCNREERPVLIAHRTCGSRAGGADDPKAGTTPPRASPTPLLVKATPTPGAQALQGASVTGVRSPRRRRSEETQVP